MVKLGLLFLVLGLDSPRRASQTRKRDPNFRASSILPSPTLQYFFRNGGHERWLWWRLAWLKGSRVLVIGVLEEVVRWPSGVQVAMQLAGTIGLLECEAPPGSTWGPWELALHVNDSFGHWAHIG
ncbi:hypothetical protein V6N12_058410 [Hibiscus sabdariffa]|uniref:Uncharacterized protein n=1 Tax=Hibiscus sabdariffa TaxID=183260 RepID=A0ABR2ETX3_9ROSI